MSTNDGGKAVRFCQKRATSGRPTCALNDRHRGPCAFDGALADRYIVNRYFYIDEQQRKRIVRLERALRAIVRETIDVGRAPWTSLQIVGERANRALGKEKR